MAWRTDTTVEIEENALYNFRYQYATVTEQWKERFPSQAAEFDIDDEVVRRIRQNVVDIRWPGLTKATAADLLGTLRIDDKYAAAQAQHIGAGGYDVVAESVEIDPDGWSNWILVENLEKWT